MNTSTLVQKLWNYCNVLRDDGKVAAPAGTRSQCLTGLAALAVFRNTQFGYGCTQYGY